MTTLLLPSRIEKHNFYRVLDKFIQNNPVLPTEITLDFQNFTFARPPGVVSLSLLASWLQDAGADISFVNINTLSKGIRYLDDCTLFEQHFGEKLINESKCRATTIPLTRLEENEYLTWINHEFTPWLCDKTGLSENSLAEVSMGLKELFNNISDHTHYKIGSIFGQWYPKEKQIILSLADFGLGIPESVRKIMPDLSDNQAILKSVQDGFSTQSLPSNRGVGLHLLLLNIVERFHGKIAIRSLTGYVEFVNRDGKIHYTTMNNIGFCVGTTIDLVIYTDKIEEDNEVEELLEW